MAESGEYKRVHFNQKQSTVTGNPAAGSQQADVAGVRHNGQVDTVEIRSNSQKVATLDAKGETMQSKMSPEMRGKYVTITVDDAVSGRGFGMLGSVGKAVGGIAPVAGLPGALLDARKQPMSFAEFLARATGTYGIAVATGTLPPPPEEKYY